MIFQIYYSEETHTIPICMLEGKCEVRKKQDLPSVDLPPIFDHIFFCECLYDPSKGSVKQVPFLCLFGGINLILSKTLRFSWYGCL